MLQMSIGETDLVRSICQESFYEFVKEFWGTIISRKAVWNWHIKYLCDELQYMAERVHEGKPKEYDLIINISPGSTKSTIASVMFPAWVWTYFPTAQFITASYTKDLAMDLSRRSRDVVISQSYQQCWDFIKLRTDQNVKTHFQNEKGGFRVAVGTGGITGFHGHFIIVDDPLDPNEASSDAELKSANDWMDETLSTRKVEKWLTPTILIMQRLHQNDPSANMLIKSEGRVKHICIPAEVTDDIRPKELKAFYKDGLMDVKRLPRSVLDSYRKTLGEYGYAGQFLQNPVPKGGGAFKVNRIQFGQPPDRMKIKEWVKLIRFWDKAGTSGGGAFTVGVLMGKDKDQRFWILDVVRGQWDSAERERVIKRVAEMDGRHIVVGVEQEPGSGGKGSVEDTIRNLAGWRVEVDRPTGDKELRADPFSVQVNAGNVWMPAGCQWATEYIEELRYFPYSTYKDQVDASSGAFSRLTAFKKAGGFFALRKGS